MVREVLQLRRVSGSPGRPHSLSNEGPTGAGWCRVQGPPPAGVVLVRVLMMHVQDEGGRGKLKGGEGKRRSLWGKWGGGCEGPTCYTLYWGRRRVWEGYWGREVSAVWYTCKGW